ncbi:hypothetical protein [Altererythrobacter sp. Root672]|uniref:hypothetical protein n=1 Tax=Altererythrobacter sp. Root672 TaxID=1736584 RepID=UPI0006F33E0C|nr:hypothetical protein [Altererythrobacter sp. Root672]KRA81400.1 hypothetical protein ASD76_12650 [Altererythrobacter sp. Root672]
MPTVPTASPVSEDYLLRFTKGTDVFYTFAQATAVFKESEITNTSKTLFEELILKNATDITEPTIVELASSGNLAPEWAPFAFRQSGK